MAANASSRRREQEKDPGLQLAPADGEGPNLPALKRSFENVVRDCTSYVSQCRQNYETRFAIWNGQASDGKKHAREGEHTEPTPWDGASDLRVYLVDEAINAKVAQQSMARRKANLVGVPTQGMDIERAKVVSLFMKWLMNTQIPEIDREDELLANYLQEKGVAITGQFWEVTQEKTLDVLKLEDFQQLVPKGTDLKLMIKHPQLEETFISVLMQHYDVSHAKAQKMINSLVRTGECSYPVTGRAKSFPTIRAYNLDEDIFIAPYVTDIEMAPEIHLVRYLTPEKLRGLANSEKWDSDWVEAAIKKCKGRSITIVPDRNLAPISRNFVFRYQRFNELVGVVYSFQRLSDEDGIPGIYLTIFNPDLAADEKQQGYAKSGLLGYRHGRYPFTLHRREFLSRRLHDSRGMPEVGKSYQDQIKSHRDARIDAASVAILPPLMYPLGRPPSRWGPGARIPERRQGEYHYGDQPHGDVNTENSEKILMESYREYTAMRSAEGDNQLAILMNQFEVDKYLSGWADACQQVWKLYQQFGPQEVFFRVIGLQKATPQIFKKGNPDEDFDFYLSFDVLQFDREAATEKVENIIKICMAADKNGQTDWSQVLQIGLDEVDPSIAERIIQPKETATTQAVNAEQMALAQIFAGIDKDITPGAPAQLGLQIIGNYLQGQDVHQKYMTDDSFRQRIDKRSKQYQFQMTQSNNARIGKLGA